VKKIPFNTFRMSMPFLSAWCILHQHMWRQR